MTSLNELMAQKAALETQIENARARELGDAISKVRALIAEHKLTAQDVFPKGAGKKSAKSVAKPGGKVAPKYKDPQTGATWTGRGIAPKWLAGKNKADYLIA